MRKFLTIAVAVVAVFTACKKADFDTTVTGEAVGPLTLLSPGNDSVALNPATPTQTITFKWTAAAPGVNSAVKYRVITKRREATTFEPANRVFELASDNSGAATQLTVTYKQLEDVLKNTAFASAARVELAWTVEAYNEKDGSNMASSSNVLILKRSTNGTTPFSILGPETSTSPKTINPNSTTENVKFNWTKSIPASGSPAVRYVVNVYKDNDASTPLFKMVSDNNGADSLVTITQKAFSDSLTKYGYTELAAAAGLKWNVTATSGTWVQNSDFTNQLYIVREVKMFIVGSATPIDWDIANALRMIEDKRNPGVFYMYVSLKAGDLKFVNDQQWPPAPGVMDYGQKKSAAAGELAEQDEENIAIGTAGVYRITVDTKNNKYYIQSQHGRMGIVGGGTVADWNPGAVFPSQEMGFAATNLFVGITNVTSNGEFKMLDNSDWPNGSLNYTRDYEDGGSGKLIEDGNTNFKWTGATGPVRVIWDYRDVKNPKYVVNAATEMRVVGNGINGVAEWSPGTSPQMTYLGNGRWTITLALIGGKDIKFLAGNDWGAFDYEDASGGSTATGTARKIKWDGSDNFKTPAASGTYTIVLDEYKQTVTIN